MKKQLLATALAGLTCVAATATFMSSPASAAVATRGTYTPVDPVRVLDTRDGTGVAGQHPGPLGAGQVTKLHIVGVGGVPEAGAAAVVLNMTVTQAPGAGFITVDPCGDPRPNASSVNFEHGVDVANQVAAKIGTNGDVCFFANAQVQLVADLNGWYADDFAAVPGFRYHELDPARILDTRDGTGLGTRAIAPLAAGEVIALTIPGSGGVPSDADVRAVTMNITTDNPVSAGYLTIFPCDHVRPNTSNVNFDPASAGTVANLVTVKVTQTGQVCIFASVSTNVIADAQGYFAPGPGSVFTSVSPVRILDSRDGTGVVGSHAGRLGRGEVLVVHVTDANGVPADAKAVLLNLTITQAENRGFATVFPCGHVRPNASNLNFTRGVDRANLVKARVGDNGNVCVFVSEGTQVIADLNGYFTPVAA